MLHGEADCWTAVTLGSKRGWRAIFHRPRRRIVLLSPTSRGGSLLGTATGVPAALIAGCCPCSPVRRPSWVPPSSSNSEAGSALPSRRVPPRRPARGRASPTDRIRLPLPRGAPNPGHLRISSASGHVLGLIVVRLLVLKAAWNRPGPHPASARCGPAAAPDNPERAWPAAPCPSPSTETAAGAGLDSH